ncbi:MAG: hypothetical protein CFH21_00893 [Alphaproteobacteria bacterium MarineAlpha5_Bin11]|nr:MAG: hypothetical protein CFH21_00893 [Alphaproteobacteria bacterium MarineAlpha5_Bin11]|tara:strand:- start:27815 stop:28363 length:549 start_codon:yes stop_codon:yes gene_type:complete
MLLKTSVCNFGWKAEDFNLKSVDEKFYDLNSIKGINGTLIMFICNHCPYVKAIKDKIAYESKALKNIGINTAAIMSNDTLQYPEDSFENMKVFSDSNNFDFPYLFDESQEIAKKYDAVCTPDFYGFNNNLELQYRGRLDSKGKNSNTTNVKRELFDAMTIIAKSGKGPKEQHASMGCSIKWR